MEGCSTFGKTFKTRKEANQFVRNYKHIDKSSIEIRLLSKKLFPRRTKRYHVGNHLDFLNFS